MEQTHSYAAEKQGKRKEKNMGCIREYTRHFTPTKHLIIFAIGVSVTTPIFGKVSAICLALLFSE